MSAQPGAPATSNEPRWLKGFLGLGYTIHLVRSDTLASKCGISGKTFREDPVGRVTCNRCENVK